MYLKGKQQELQIMGQLYYLELGVYLLLIVITQVLVLLTLELIVILFMQILLTDGTADINEGAIEVIVLTSGESLDGYEPIAHSTSASISFNNDLRDVTTKDSAGFQENIGGLKSFELSADALQDINADLDFKEFYDDINERNEVIIKFAERDSGVRWEGSGYISSLSMDAGVEENVTYSVSITGTSSVVKGTY